MAKTETNEILENEKVVSEKKAKTETVKVRVNCTLLNVRKEPNYDAKILRTVKQDEILTAVPYSADWYKLPNGYVAADFVTVEN